MEGQGGYGTVRRGRAWLVMVRHGKAGCGEARRLWRGMARYGETWQGWVWRGGYGGVWQGEVWLGEARQVLARRLSI